MWSFESCLGGHGLSIDTIIVESKEMVTTINTEVGETRKLVLSLDLINVAGEEVVKSKVAEMERKAFEG